MSSDFVPFIPAVAKSMASCATTDSAATAEAFAALGKSASPAATPTQGNQPFAALCANTPDGAIAKPTVTLQKNGDRVTHIRVQCCCGQVVELECAY